MEPTTAQINKLLESIKVITITPAIEAYAIEKTRLRQSGIPIDNFDLLIGCTAVVKEMVMVSNNTKHFERIQKIKLEDWTMT